jgi:N-acetylmuramoyl-L-alanine amidase
MGKKTIMLDPGHGGKDPGAVVEVDGFRIVEANLNLALAFLVRECLCVLEPGLAVTLTRCSDEATLALSERCFLANGGDPALFVSIHCNAAENTGARGLEVWTTPGETRADPAAQRIAEKLQVAHKLRPDLSDGDLDREERFYVLAHTRCPAVLVECGFITNPEDQKMLRSFQGREQIAQAIAEGILDWLKEA